MTQKTIEQQMIKLAKILYDKGYIAAADGNMSYHLDGNKILITPSGVHKGFLEPKQLAIITPDGDPIKGTASSETHMHLSIYNKRSDVRAIIHAHPPHAIAWSLAFPEHKALPTEALPEVILGTGNIPIADWAPPGTPAMASMLQPHISDHNTIILSKHGVISYGRDLMEALNGIERAEHAAQTLTIAKTLGNISTLSVNQLAKVWEIRKNLGLRNL